MTSKALFTRWAAMSAGTSVFVLSLALSVATPRAEDAPAAAEPSAALVPLADILPLDRPVAIATESPAAAIVDEAGQAAATVDVVIPPPDLPPVEVLIEVEQAKPQPADTASRDSAPAEPATQEAAQPAPGAVPVQQATSGAPAAAPPSVEISLPELPPDVPPPVIVADAPSDPLLPIATALKTHFAAALPAKGTTAIVSRRDRELIQHFYEARDFRPLFVGTGGLTRAGLGVARQVATAETDGLDPSSYPLPSLGGETPSELASVEFDTALAAFAYARDARGGRLEPSHLSALITPDRDLPLPGDVLGKLADTADAAATLASFQPQHPGYKALKEKLAELRESTGAIGQHIAVGEGTPLRVGMRDPRVPNLRARLGLAAGTDADRNEVFDSEVSQALADWQRKQGLRPTGRLERGMGSALDGRVAGGIGAADIVANMERWRWLPEDLGERHIEVNLPEYTLRVVQDGKVIHQTRVVIGKTQTPTPIFSNKMQYVVVNPYWNIPPSIMKKEILPKLAEDPNYATAHGYEVIRRGNSIAVRQPPGERNALGFIKFLFPNQHSVYLHDTPSRALFAQNRRAFSHGCVRVEQPFRLGQIVLGDEGYDEDRLRKMVGKGERTIRLKEPLPIHLTYFTLFVDENGRLQRRDDLYGYDGRIRTALGISANGLTYANLR
jgi:L,D-transpeptidase YcbB